MFKYYGVVYLLDGTIHLWPGDNQKDCLDELIKIRDSEWGPRIKATTVIKRNMDNFKDDLIFGNPKSLNVMGGK